MHTQFVLLSYACSRYNRTFLIITMKFCWSLLYHVICIPWSFECADSFIPFSSEYFVVIYSINTNNMIPSIIDFPSQSINSSNNKKEFLLPTFFCSSIASFVYFRAGYSKWKNIFMRMKTKMKNEKKKHIQQMKQTIAIPEKWRKWKRFIKCDGQKLIRVLFEKCGCVNTGRMRMKQREIERRYKKK